MSLPDQFPDDESQPLTWDRAQRDVHKVKLATRVRELIILDMMRKLTREGARARKKARVKRVDTWKNLPDKLKSKYPAWRCLERDLFFLRLSHEERLGPAAIRDRARAKHKEWHVPEGTAGRQLVLAALKNARRRLTEAGI